MRNFAYGLLGLYINNLGLEITHLCECCDLASVEVQRLAKRRESSGQEIQTVNLPKRSDGIISPRNLFDE